MAPEAQQPADESELSSKVEIPIRRRPGASYNDVTLETYVSRDSIHGGALIDRSRRDEEYLRVRKWSEIVEYKSIRNQYRNWFRPSQLYGMGYSGYGNGHTEGPAGILYPAQKPRKGRRKTALLRVSRKMIKEQAETGEELVPIRLDVDWEKVKLRDTFTWNLHDQAVPIRLFAEQLVEDFGLLPPASDQVLGQVIHQLNEQIGDFYPPVFFEEERLDIELPYHAYKNDEMRILIKLNITIGPHTLVDQFEWEINNPMNSPEEFAQSLSKELSLSGEFTTAIAHCIREQSQLFTRSLYIIGHPFDGRPIEDADLVAAFLPSPLTSVFRPQQQAKDYTPFLYELSEADMEKEELIISREQRRQKRSVNRRGGPVLPDLKDRQRTVRTLVVSSVLPGAAETIEESRIYKRAVGGPRGKKTGLRDGLIESEDSESEDSSPDSPALSQALQGTARTRGMRGAATAAQQRMANLGRSETPEASTLHHHETRTSARRFGGRDLRDDSAEGPLTLIVKLKVGRERLRQFQRGKSARPQSLQSSSYTHNRSQSAVSGAGTPAPAGSMGPPLTPSLANQPLATSSTPGSANPAVQIGRLDAPPPPGPGQPPNPPPPAAPAWLTEGLTALLKTYPNDRFEGVMRHSCVDSRTDIPCQAPAAGAPVPAHIKWMYLPRIRCHDCPGKLYTPGPGMTVENFEVHLKNRAHRDKVNSRVGF